MRSEYVSLLVGALALTYEIGCWVSQANRQKKRMSIFWGVSITALSAMVRRVLSGMGIIPLSCNTAV